jgi:hypothetical protein
MAMSLVIASSQGRWKALVRARAARALGPGDRVTMLARRLRCGRLCTADSRMHRHSSRCTQMHVYPNSGTIRTAARAPRRRIPGAAPFACAAGTLPHNRRQPGRGNAGIHGELGHAGSLPAWYRARPGTCRTADSAVQPERAPPASGLPSQGHRSDRPGRFRSARCAFPAELPRFRCIFLSGRRRASKPA